MAIGYALLLSLLYTYRVVTEQDKILHRTRTGQAFLSMVFFIGGIMVIVGITMAVIAATFIDSGYGIQAANLAEATATGGAEDAYLQLVRNSTFQDTAGYWVPGTSSTIAIVTVTQSFAECGHEVPAGYAVAASASTVNGRTRVVQAVFAINALTGQVSVVSWDDLPANVYAPLFCG